MVIDPIFSALSDRASNLVATAIGANQKVRTSCVSGHTELPRLGGGILQRPGARMEVDDGRKVGAREALEGAQGGWSAGRQEGVREIG